MILLVDIGNTLIKFAISNGKKEAINMLITTETKNENWDEKLIKTFETVKEKVTGAIISCVVPDKLKPTFELIKQHFKIEAVIINSALIKKLPIKFNLNNQQIGSDLLAMAIGSNNYYGDCITISIGTATTYSIIKKNELIGVIIGPGFTSSKNVLVTDAALIESFILQNNNSVLGVTTNHALSIGFGNGFNYMLSGTINAINKQLNCTLPVIITGNGYSELQPFLTFDYQYNRKILMMGLIIIYHWLKKNNKIK